jgi:hypothetical protein
MADASFCWRWCQTQSVLSASSWNSIKGDNVYYVNHMRWR